MKARNLTKETISDLAVQERNFPDFGIGDVIAVSQWVQEGETKRIQIFEGNVIARHNNGASSTFTVRKKSANDIAVERIYPYYSGMIDSIKLVSRADVRRAKLYYIRDRVGKAGAIKKRVEKKVRETAAAV